MQGTKVMHIFVLSKRKRIMNVDNVKSQMRKGMLEYCIMLLLHKEPAYASDIIQKLKEAQLIVVEGTLYPLLTRLKNDDLLSYEWVESTQGPPRKYYNLIIIKPLRSYHLIIKRNNRYICNSKKPQKRKYICLLFEKQPQMIAD